MQEWMEEREKRLREFFGLSPDVELLPRENMKLEFPARLEEHLAQFNLEWHIIPAETAVSIVDDTYRARLYPTIRVDPKQQDYKKTSSYKAVINGHRKHQGQILGIETTPKPRYLPRNRQFYGTVYGFDDRADPFAPYLGREAFLTGTRYGHDYISLCQFINMVNKEWQAHSLIPAGYRLTICPPVVFNLIGTLFHPEWSQTESLEIGFYRDEVGNAVCYAVGSNAPGDFSYIRRIETESDWSLLGFRTALIPE